MAIRRQTQPTKTVDESDEASAVMVEVCLFYRKLIGELGFIPRQPKNQEGGSIFDGVRRAGALPHKAIRDKLEKLKKTDPPNRDTLSELIGMMKEIDEWLSDYTTPLKPFIHDGYAVLARRRFWHDYSRFPTQLLIERSQKSRGEQTVIDEDDPAGGCLGRARKDRSLLFPRINLVDTSKIRIFDAQQWTVRRDLSNSLRIGLCSLGSDVYTKYRPDTNSSASGEIGFHAESVTDLTGDSETFKEDRQKYETELERVLDFCFDNNVNILLLPELCVDEPGLEVIRKKLLTTTTTHYLSLIIPGSFHHSNDDTPGVWCNKAPIWLVAEREKKLDLLDQQFHSKLQPFGVESCAVQTVRDECLKAKQPPRFSNLVNAVPKDEGMYLLESIDCRVDPQFHLLWTDLGSFGVLICKDFLLRGSPRLSSSLEQYFRAVDHLLIVSMQPEPAPDFRVEAKVLADFYGTAVFYVNCRNVVVGRGLEYGNKSKTELRNESENDLVFWHIPKIPRKIRQTVLAEEMKGRTPDNPVYSGLISRRFVLRYKKQSSDDDPTVGYMTKEQYPSNGFPIAEIPIE